MGIFDQLLSSILKCDCSSACDCLSPSLTNVNFDDPSDLPDPIPIDFYWWDGCKTEGGISAIALDNLNPQCELDRTLSEVELYLMSYPCLQELLITLRDDPDFPYTGGFCGLDLNSLPL